MPFAWSKKVVRVMPVVSDNTISITTASGTKDAEVTQIVVLPVVHDKISVLEHKNGEQVADARKEDDEAHEVQGLVQEGRRTEEGDNGS